jgi:hypothetical protein
MMAAGWVCGMAFVIFYISSAYVGRSLLHVPEGATEGLLRFVHGRLMLRLSFKRKAQYISRRRCQLPPIDIYIETSNCIGLGTFLVGRAEQRGGADVIDAAVRVIYARGLPCSYHTIILYNYITFSVSHSQFSNHDLNKILGCRHLSYLHFD